MKQVLIIDESPLLRDYLRFKLAGSGVGVQTAINGLDGMAKLRALMPDLAIIDYNLSRFSCQEILDEKRRNPNIAATPVIITARHIDQKRLIDLMNYNVKKVFTKPILVDAFCRSLAELLSIDISVDTSPSRVDVFINDSILFIDIALGLNSDKLDILRLRIAELLNLYQIANLHILISFSETAFSFVDAPKLELLLKIVLDIARNYTQDIRVLSSDEFVKLYVSSDSAYAGIIVTDSFEDALDGMLADTAGKKTGDKPSGMGLPLPESKTPDAGLVQFRFQADDAGMPSQDELKDFGKQLNIAAVDDDFVIQELLKTTFGEIGASVTAFPDGDSFLRSADLRSFDLVFLDLLMPKTNGFDVLRRLREDGIDLPIIVFSAVSRRDVIVKAFQSGIKSYLVKPLSPTAIFKKAIEILRPNI